MIIVAFGAFGLLVLAWLRAPSRASVKTDLD
jgi:hypothetical protein